jgi:hypothetical protein
MSTLQQNWKKKVEQVLPGSEGGWEERKGGEMAQIMCTHMNK